MKDSISENEAYSFIHTYDYDNDGEISFEEFL
jgi:Ca2+-binding EF-hand superfamily protein